jgi:hypothetical protein
VTIAAQTFDSMSSINSSQIVTDKYDGVGFEVLTAVSTKMTVFWVVAPCSLVEVYTALQPRRQPSKYDGIPFPALILNINRFLEV